MNKPLVSKLPDADMQAVPAALIRAGERAREIARKTVTAEVGADGHELITRAGSVGGQVDKGQKSG